MSLRVSCLLASLTVVISGLNTSRAAAQTQPNILIFVLDDFGNSKVSGYAVDYAGYAAAATYLPETRTIDELAAAGLRFSRAWASPNCSPTRGSLQTGRQPYVHGIGSPLPPGGPTLQSPELDTNVHPMLADAFRAAGYATGYFGKWHLGVTDEAGSTTPPPAAFTVRPHPALAGWERFVGTIDGDVDDYFNWGLVRWDEATLSGLSMNEVTHATTKTARAARNWIEQQEGPFLALVSFHAPHSTNGTWDYDEVDSSMIRSSDILDCVNTPGLCDEERAAYAALVEHADIQIERTLAAMDPEVLANTLIFVMGDNGTPDDVQEGAFNVAGRSKGTAYETGIRIPLIVAHGNTYLNGGAGAITYPGTVIRAGGPRRRRVPDAPPIRLGLQRRPQRGLGLYRLLHQQRSLLRPHARAVRLQRDLRAGQHRRLHRRRGGGSLRPREDGRAVGARRDLCSGRVLRHLRRSVRDHPTQLAARRRARGSAEGLLRGPTRDAEPGELGVWPPGVRVISLGPGRRPRSRSAL